MNQPSPAKSILIVESHNDAAFIRLLLRDLDIHAELSVVIEDLHKFLDESGTEQRGKGAIGTKLKSIRRSLEKKYPNVQKFGVILDFDSGPHWDFGKNLALVNAAFAGAFDTDEHLFSREAELVEVKAGGDGQQFQAACFFTKDSSGEGNLDTLLLEIRANPTAEVPYADCLALWRDCVNQSKSPLQVTPSVYGKIWLGNFLRAQAKGLGAAGKSILSDFEDKQNEVMEQVGAAVFDLNHPSLSGMRAFLEMFR